MDLSRNFFVFEAQNTFPPPERNADILAKIPAPSIDFDPPRQSIEPLFPLWADLDMLGMCIFSLAIDFMSGL